jgi:putative PIN family toxin of toxin-antitoxin system
MSPANLRVVLDTNLVLSALIFRKGRLSIFRELWQTERFNPLISKATATEFMRALAYPKFKLSGLEQEELWADYLTYCTVVNIPNPPPATPICRDPGDIPFLKLALAGHADYLVTGDKDLLILAGEFACPIVSAESFLTVALED